MRADFVQCQPRLAILVQQLLHAHEQELCFVNWFAVSYMMCTDEQEMCICMYPVLTVCAVHAGGKHLHLFLFLHVKFSSEINEAAIGAVRICRS